jgi:hypothetical protein
MIDLHPEHARTVLAELPVGLVVLDQRERVSWLNPRALCLLDVALEQALGRVVDALPIPYAPADVSSTGMAVRVRGPLLGVTQRYSHATGHGALVMLYERSHALVGYLATLDAGMAASGALNHAALKARLDAEISRSRRYANPLSCITLRLGSGAQYPGTGLLVRLLKEQLRWVDLLGHWTDELLLVVLPETAEQAAAILTGKLRTAVPAAAADGDIDSGDIAIGYAAWQRGDNAERMVCRALASAEPAVTRQTSVCRN